MKRLLMGLLALASISAFSNSGFMSMEDSGAQLAITKGSQQTIPTIAFSGERAKDLYDSLSDDFTTEHPISNVIDIRKSTGPDQSGHASCNKMPRDGNVLYSCVMSITFDN